MITIVTWRQPTAPIDLNVLDLSGLDARLRHVTLALGSVPTNRG